MRAAKGEAGDPGAHRDQPRGHPRHARRPRHLTTRGGMTSHAAVVARGMGGPASPGAGNISVDYGAQTLTAGGAFTVRAGKRSRSTAPPARYSSARADDRTGHVRRFRTLMEWADGLRRMKVRTNAETPLDAETARKFGAEGIGLCRTEHMFFDPARIGVVRQMIMAHDETGRRAALAKLLPFQRDRISATCSASWPGCPSPSACSIRRCTNSCPTRRLNWPRWRPPSGEDLETIRRRADELKEANPMLGHRGCRLGISRYPEIYEMQARAIFEGAIGRHRGNREGRRSGDHDPAGRHQAGAGDHPCPGRPHRGRGVQGNR